MPTLTPNQISTISTRTDAIRNHAESLWKLRDALHVLGCDRGVETVEEVYFGVTEAAALIDKDVRREGEQRTEATRVIGDLKEAG